MQLKFLVKNSNDPAVAMYAIQNLDSSGMPHCLKNAVDKFRMELQTHLVMISTNRDYHHNRKVENTAVNDFLRKEEFRLKQLQKAGPVDFIANLDSSSTKLKSALDTQNRKLGKLMQEFQRQQFQNMIKQQQKQQLELTTMFRELIKVDDDVLRHKLDDPNPFVRMLAIQVAGRKRLVVEKEAIALLADANPPIRQAARQTLVRLGRGTDFGPEPTATGPQIASAVQSWNAWRRLQEEASAEERADTPPTGPK